MQIEYDRQIGEAFYRADISDVRHAGGSESAGAGGKADIDLTFVRDSITCSRRQPGPQTTEMARFVELSAAACSGVACLPRHQVNGISGATMLNVGP